MSATDLRQEFEAAYRAQIESNGEIITAQYLRDPFTFSNGEYHYDITQGAWEGFKLGRCITANIEADAVLKAADSMMVCFTHHTRCNAGKNQIYTVLKQYSEQLRRDGSNEA